MRIAMLAIATAAVALAACSSNKSPESTASTGDTPTAADDSADGDTPFGKIDPNNPLAAAAAAMKMAQAMQETAAQPAGTEALNWRALTEFVPDSVEGFAASGKINGQSTNMGGLQVTEVNRNYAAGEQQLEIKILDTSLVPQLRAPFAMAAAFSEDSDEGYKKGKQIAGQSAIVEWRESDKRSQATLLVGGRFLLEVEIEPANKPDQAEAVASALALDKLAALAK